MSTLKPGKPWTTRLSSAGLIYAHYGEAVIAHILEKKPHDEAVQQIYDKMYENFIEEIDAIDNGIMLNESPMKYRITTHLSARVSRLNPNWRDSSPDEWAGFQNALKVVGSEFVSRVHEYSTDWWESFAIVRAAMEARFQVISLIFVYFLSDFNVYVC